MTESTPPLPNLAVLQLWELAVNFEARLATELAELGLSGSTFRLVGELMHAPDGLRQGELARRLGVRPPTVSAAVSRLERDGLVLRKKDPDDPRARRVCLAENADLGAGFEVLLRLENTLVDGLTPLEVDAMRGLLTTLNQRLAPPETP